MYEMEDVIAAIATPVGSGGIGIVRMSGYGCIEIVERIFVPKNGIKPSSMKSHTISYGNILYQGGFIDEVLLSVMRAPHTYTKEDVVEINCHGGLLVQKKMVEILLQEGARSAQPGEFTKRAFLNGRIDLSQAEAVIDMIQAKTELSLSAAAGQMAGQLKETVQALREKLITNIAVLEAAIDYPEHALEFEQIDDISKHVEALQAAIQSLLDTADQGRILRQGLQAAIVGRPNVGKSSLLNCLLQDDRAIVTEIAGTTRDTLEEFINIGGIPVKLIDTAGIRQSENTVEQIGVKKSYQAAQEADLLLVVLDASTALCEQDLTVLQLIKGSKALILCNKEDKGCVLSKDMLKPFAPPEQIIYISAKENTGMLAIAEYIKALFFNGDIAIQDKTLISNVRQKEALVKAQQALSRAAVALDTGIPVDLVSMDLQEANLFLGEITGDVAEEEIIDRIFSEFCLGK